MPGPPKYGSLLEAMCVLVFRYRQQLSLLGQRAQAQASLGGEAAETAFKELADFVSRVEVEDTTKKMRERLAQFQDKAIKFRPMVETQRKLNVPIVSRQQVEESGVLDQPVKIIKGPARPARARARRKR